MEISCSSEGSLLPMVSEVETLLLSVVQCGSMYPVHTWFSLGPVSSDHLCHRASALECFLWKTQQVIEHDKEDGGTSLLGLLVRVSA